MLLVLPLHLCRPLPLDAKSLHIRALDIQQTGQGDGSDAVPGEVVAALPPDPPRGVLEENEALTVSAAVEEEPAILDVHRDIFQQTWRHSPDIRMARLEVEQKASQRVTAWARRLAPKVDLELSQKQYFNKSDSSSGSSSDSGTSASSSSYLVGAEDTPAADSTSTASDDAFVDGDSITNWEFTLDMPLYRRSVSLALDAARQEEELAGLLLDIKTRELDTRVRSLLGNYLLARYKLLNLRNSVELASAHVTRIQRGYELRDQTRLALLRAEANLKELEARREINEQQQEAAFRELLNFSGMNGDEPVFGWLRELTAAEARTAGCITVLADLARGLEHVGELTRDNSPESLRQRFVASSPLAKRYGLERRLNDTRAKTYTQSEWPELAIKGEYARQEDTRLSDYRGEGNIGIVFTVPLFSGGTLWSNRRSRETTQRMSSLGEFSQLRGTYYGLENQKKSIESLQEVLNKQRINLQQQEEIVRLSIKSFKMKETSMQDLLTAQNKLIDSKNQQMSSTIELGALLRQFAWILGDALPSPPPPQP